VPAPIFFDEACLPAYDGGMRRREKNGAPRDLLIGRRAFGAGVVSTLALGCGSDPLTDVADAGADAGPPVDPDLLALHPFVGEGPLATVKTGVGLDARKRFDLTTLTEGALDVGVEAFFVRTERPDQLPEGEPRALVVGGLVEREAVVTAADLVAAAKPMGLHVLECSGNTRESAFGLVSATAFAGVPIAEVLAKVSPRDPGARVLVSGFDGHSRASEGGHSVAGASWIFSRAELEQRGAFLATHMGGLPLTADHGAPARLLVPGYYGCTAIKWVDRLELVADDAPATPHMKEFAGRTHQHYAFDLAREYAPAALQAAALCTRAEHRKVSGKARLVLRGIVWGGTTPATLVRIFIGNAAGDPVLVRAPASTAASWGMWEYVAPPLAPGRYAVRLRVEPIETPQRRLDSDWYVRVFEVKA